MISKIVCSECEPPPLTPPPHRPPAAVLCVQKAVGGRRLGGLTATLPPISLGNTFGFNYSVPLGNELL